MVKTVEYPSPTCILKGPVTDVIHPSIEGPNWKIVSEGDPIFISVDGNLKVTPFVHPKPDQENGSVDLYTMFVNEAAYQEKNVAFALYEKLKKPVY